MDAKRDSTDSKVPFGEFFTQLAKSVKIQDFDSYKAQQERVDKEHRQGISEVQRGVDTVNKGVEDLKSDLTNLGEARKLSEDHLFQQINELDAAIQTESAKREEEQRQLSAQLGDETRKRREDRDVLHEEVKRLIQLLEAPMKAAEKAIAKLEGRLDSHEFLLQDLGNDIKTLHQAEVQSRKELENRLLSHQQEEASLRDVLLGRARNAREEMQTTMAQELANEKRAHEEAQAKLLQMVTEQGSLLAAVDERARTALREANDCSDRLQSALDGLEKRKEPPTSPCEDEPQGQETGPSTSLEIASAEAGKEAKGEREGQQEAAAQARVNEELQAHVQQQLEEQAILCQKAVEMSESLGERMGHMADANNMECSTLQESLEMHVSELQACVKAKNCHHTELENLRTLFEDHLEKMGEVLDKEVRGQGDLQQQMELVSKTNQETQAQEAKLTQQVAEQQRLCQEAMEKSEQAVMSASDTAERFQGLHGAVMRQDDTLESQGTELEGLRASLEAQSARLESLGQGDSGLQDLRRQLGLVWESSSEQQASMLQEVQAALESSEAVKGDFLRSGELWQDQRARLEDMVGQGIKGMGLVCDEISQEVKSQEAYMQRLEEQQMHNLERAEQSEQLRVAHTSEGNELASFKASWEAGRKELEESVELFKRGVASRFNVQEAGLQRHLQEQESLHATALQEAAAVSRQEEKVEAVISEQRAELSTLLQESSLQRVEILEMRSSFAELSEDISSHRETAEAKPHLASSEMLDLQEAAEKRLEAAIEAAIEAANEDAASEARAAAHHSTEAVQRMESELQSTQKELMASISCTQGWLEDAQAALKGKLEAQEARFQQSGEATEMLWRQALQRTEGLLKEELQTQGAGAAEAAEEAAIALERRLELRLEEALGAAKRARVQEAGLEQTAAQINELAKKGSDLEAKLEHAGQAQEACLQRVIEEQRGFAEKLEQASEQSSKANRELKEALKVDFQAINDLHAIHRTKAEEEASSLMELIKEGLAEAHAAQEATGTRLKEVSELQDATGLRLQEEIKEGQTGFTRELEEARHVVQLSEAGQADCTEAVSELSQQVQELQRAQAEMERCQEAKEASTSAVQSGGDSGDPVQGSRDRDRAEYGQLMEVVAKGLLESEEQAAECISEVKKDFSSRFSRSLLEATKANENAIQNTLARQEEAVASWMEEFKTELQAIKNQEEELRGSKRRKESAGVPPSLVDSDFSGASSEVPTRLLDAKGQQAAEQARLLKCMKAVLSEGLHREAEARSESELKLKRRIDALEVALKQRQATQPSVSALPEVPPLALGSRKGDNRAGSAGCITRRRAGQDLNMESGLAQLRTHRPPTLRGTATPPAPLLPAPPVPLLPEPRGTDKAPLDTG